MKQVHYSCNPLKWSRLLDVIGSIGSIRSLFVSVFQGLLAVSIIGLITVFDAILTSRHSG